MQKTIYISDQALWDSIKAMTNGKSISRYLVDLHLDNVARHRDNVARLRADAIRADRSVVDSLTGQGRPLNLDSSRSDRSTPGGG